MSISLSAQDTGQTSASVSLYRAIWRWHFFAGLLVIPFLINLAVTGSIYLFKDEINNSIFAYRNLVVAEPQESLPPQKLVEAALLAVPGANAVSYRDPASPDRSALVKVQQAESSILVFVNPYTGAVLDTVSAEQEFNFVVKRLHSLAYFGTYANRLTEIAGGFALVLVVTGFYLWWPRQQRGGVLTVRGTPSKRVFWRDTHAVTGAFASVLIFFLALTGMPWSGYWGNNVNSWLTAHNLGYPAQLWDDVPLSSQVMQEVADKTAWIMEQSPVPLSTTATASAMPIGLDKAVAIAKQTGIKSGFETSIPGDATGVYTASLYPDDLAFERTIHIDQYSGKPLVDISYGQYPVLGKTIEWGINVHQGQEWGRFNQFLMLATCLALVLSCVTAIVMWWKRRPAGRLGVPPMPPSRSVYMGLWLIVGVFGLAFPMTGLAIVVMIAFDQLAIRFIPSFKRIFS